MQKKSTSFLILIVFVFSFLNVFSQTKNNPFSDIDISKVKTGFLYNKVKLPVSNIHDCNGTSKIKVLNSFEWRDIYSEISRSSLKKDFVNYQNLKKSIKSKIRKNIFPVGIVNFSYNEFKKNAIESSSVKIINNKFIIENENVLDKFQVFAASVIDKKQYTGLSPIFDFSKEYYFSNSETKLISIKVDFNDAKGYRDVNLNDKIKINYQKDGIKTIKIKAVFENNVSLKTIFTLDVKSTRMPPPDETWTDYTADESYLGEFAHGEVGVFFGNGNSNFTRPVIIVDGFDPGDTRDIAGLWDIANQQNMVDNLTAEGYDFVIVNFYGGDDYIQRNAMLVKKVIQEINMRMTSAGTMKDASQIVVIGPSMGGLITRFALRKMEQDGLNHNVRNWIAFDSPMKGADIPLGLQHWVRFFAEEADVESAQEALTALSGPAAKQMLVYHYTGTSGNTANNNGLYTSFYNELNVMGFPQNTRIASIVNGDGYGNGQGFFGGDKIIYYRYRSFLVDLDGDVWAVPNQTYHQIFEGLYNPIGWTNESENIYVNNTLPYDGAPGGNRNTLQELADTDPGYGDITAPWDSHAFIPTISALCIQNTTDPYFNVDANINSIVTPFDKIYYPSENQEHVAITPESYTWFYHEVINFAPEFTSTPITSVDEDANYSYTLTATDENEWNVLTYELVEKPEWLNFNSATGEFLGTPLNEDVGIHNVSVKVKDELDETIQTFIITVSNTNDAPVVTSTAFETATEDTEYTYTFKATDEDPTVDVLTLSAVTIPTWLNFDASTGILSGTPLNEDVGTHNITLNVNDGTVDVEQNFTITVANTNDAPVVTSTAIETATEDTEYTYTFTATDEDPTGNVLTLSAVTIPSWLSFDSGTGILSGTPLNEDVGTHNVTLRVNDGTVDVDQIFSITVSNTNDAPTLENNLIDQEATEGEFFTYTFAENTFNDVDLLDVLTYSAIQNNGDDLPIWLSFNSLTRTFSGTPNVAEDYEIKVTATDNSFESVSDIFSLEVAGSIFVNKIRSEDIKMYPNPAKEILNIEYDSFIEKVEIINTQGKIIMSINDKEKKHEINVSNLPSGIYLIKMSSSNNSIFNKFIVK